MSTYNGVLLRKALDDTGNLPYTGGVVSNSPDIIPKGLVPYSDPQKTLSDDYNNKDDGTSLTMDIDNYFYMRGKNLSQESIEGDFYLYVMKPNLLIYPDQWKDKGLRVASSTEENPVYNSSFPSTAPGKIAVATNPFIWNPDTTTHHCAIGRVVSAQNPNPIPQTGTVNDLAAWLVNQGGYCWRNLQIVDKGVQWSQSTTYTQGAMGAKMYILVTCNGCPINSTISFSCGVAGPKPQIYLPPTPITTTQGFITGIHSEIPANYISNMIISYEPSGSPLQGFEITVSAQYVVDNSNPLYAHGITLSKFGLPEGSDDPLHNKQIKSLRSLEKMGPTQAIQVGTQTYI